MQVTAGQGDEPTHQGGRCCSHGTVPPGAPQESSTAIACCGTMPENSTPAWPLTSAVSGHPPGVNQRLHWQARRRLYRPFVDAVGWQAQAFGLTQPLERARVVVTFSHRSRRYVGDVDNLYARAKPLVDALKGIAIVDDSPAAPRAGRAPGIGPRALGARGGLAGTGTERSRPKAGASLS